MTYLAAMLAATVIGFVNESGSDKWRMERLDTTVSNFHRTALSVEGHARGDKFEPNNWSMRMFDWKRFETINPKLKSELYSTPRPDLVFASAFTRQNSLGLWGIRDAVKRPVAIVANNGSADEVLSIAIRGEFINVAVKPGTMAVYIAPREKVFPQEATAYDFSKLKMERLGRGTVAFRSGEKEAVVSWRYRMQDPTNIAFNVYRDGVKINRSPVSGATFFRDESFNPSRGAAYSARPVLKGRASRKQARAWTVPPNAPIGYMPLKVEPPTSTSTERTRSYTVRWRLTTTERGFTRHGWGMATR